MDVPVSVVLTNMCMIRDGSKVLVEEKVWRDLKGIILPGGHVEPFEPIVDSVIREVREETGLVIESPRLCGVKDWVNEDGSRYIVFLFRADRFSGELTSSDEGRVFWMELDDVLNTHWLWNLDGILDILADGGHSELFLVKQEDWKPVLK